MIISGVSLISSTTKRSSNHQVHFNLLSTVLLIRLPSQSPFHSNGTSTALVCTLVAFQALELNKPITFICEKQEPRQIFSGFILFSPIFMIFCCFSQLVKGAQKRDGGTAHPSCFLPSEQAKLASHLAEGKVCHVPPSSHMG